MSYSAAIDGLQALPGAPRRKFRLEEMRTLLAELGDPHQHFPSVLIAGTNGKGSTSATLASILSAAGYRVGLYTSPHLARVNERVRILEAGREAQGPAVEEIADDTFASLYFQVDEASVRLVS